MQEIELFAFLRRARVGQATKTERISQACLTHELFDLRVITFRVLAIHRRHVNRQRAIYINRNVRNIALERKLVQRQHKLLRPTHGKCRNQHHAAALHRLVDDAFHVLRVVFVRRVQPVAVGAFHDQDVGAVHKLRVTDNWQSRPPDVAAEDQPNVAFRLVIFNLENDRRAAEHVPRVNKR